MESRIPGGEQRDEWLAEIAGAEDLASLQGVEARLFGKKGLVVKLVKSVSALPADERPAAGREANQLRAMLTQVLVERREGLKAERQ